MVALALVLMECKRHAIFTEIVLVEFVIVKVVGKEIQCVVSFHVTFQNHHCMLVPVLAPINMVVIMGGVEIFVLFLYALTFLQMILQSVILMESVYPTIHVNAIVVGEEILIALLFLVTFLQNMEVNVLDLTSISVKMDG